MKKRFISLMLMLLLMAGSVMTVHADSYTGKEEWKATFDGEGIKSNFENKSISDNFPSQLQPGDDVTLTVTLENKAGYTTDWYMTNKVLSTLEESQNVADSGNYTYRLSYTSSSGQTTVLYDSQNVGGEKKSDAGQGLHEATNSLQDFLYLDRLKANERGTVSLYLKVDGETQGNRYQDTLARLQMQFATEKADTDTVTNRSQQPRRNAAKTGDTNNMFLWTLLSLISGIVLMAVAVIRRKQEKGGMYHE